MIYLDNFPYKIKTCKIYVPKDANVYYKEYYKEITRGYLNVRIYSSRVQGNTDRFFVICIGDYTDEWNEVFSSDKFF